MNKKTRNFIIHSIISLIICFIFWVVPPIQGITPVGMRIIGIILMMIYAYIALEDSAIPSVGALIIFGLSGYTSVLGAFLSATGQFAVCLVMSMLMIGGIMNSTGLARALAVKIVNAKWASGRPWALTIVVFIATIVPSMFITPLPVAVIMWSILRNIFEICEFKKGDKWPMYMVTAVTACGCIASTAMPFNVAWLVNKGMYESMGGDGSYNVLVYLLTSLLFAFAFAVVFWLVLRFIIRPDVENLKKYKAEETEPFSWEQKVALVLLAIFVVLAILPNLLPAGNFLQSFDLIGIAFVIIFISMILRKKDGSPFITFQQIGEKGVMWPILAMIGSLMTICSAMTDPELGINDVLTNLVAPITSFSPFLCYALFLAIALVGTSFLNNSVVGLVVSTILAMVGGELAFPTIALLIMFTHGAEFGILLPASAPNGALTYGQIEHGWINRKAIIKHGAIYILILYLVLLILGLPFLNVMG